MDRPDLDDRLELLRENDPDAPDPARVVAEDGDESRRWKKIQAFDSVVGAAVRKVAVPKSLSAEVLSRIGIDTTERKEKNRRRYLLAGIGSALALSLVIGFSISRWPDPTWTRPRVTEAAAAWYVKRIELPPRTNSTPPLPQVGLRGGLVAGYGDIPFLKKDAVAYRLETPAGDHAVAIIVPSVWFPADFDPSASYAIAGDVTLEVRFLPVSGGDEYCIFVASNPKAFEAKALIF